MVRLEGRWAARDEGRAGLLDAVGEGELEVGDQKLADVGAADVVGLLDLNNAEDLRGSSVELPCKTCGARNARG